MMQGFTLNIGKTDKLRKIVTNKLRSFSAINIENYKTIGPSFVNSFCFSEKLDLNNICHHLTQSIPKNDFGSVSFELGENFLRLYNTVNGKNPFQTFFFRRGPIVHWGELNPNVMKILNFVLNKIDHDRKSKTFLPHYKFRHDFKFVVDSHSSDNDLLSDITTIPAAISYCGLDENTEKNFRFHSIDFPSLPELSDFDLSTLVPKIGQRLRLSNFIRRRFNELEQLNKLRSQMQKHDTISIPLFSHPHPKPPSELLGVTFALCHSVRLEHFSKLLDAIQTDTRRLFSAPRRFAFFPLRSLTVLRARVNKWNLDFDAEQDEQVLWEEIAAEKWCLEMQRLLDYQRRVKALISRHESLEQLVANVENERNVRIGFGLENLIVALISVEVAIGLQSLWSASF